MWKTRFLLLAFLLSLSGGVYGQGLDTQANKDDWEEINFAFDSSVLTDGFPSLLRLADLLKANPSYRVELNGNADYIGSNAYNQRLGMARANTVRDFLVKYGASGNQISVVSSGETNPRVQTRNREGRFMNRRVYVTIKDGQGNPVGAATGGGVSDAIKQLEALAKKQQECCDEILKRLDKLDDILAMLRDLKAENDRLKGEVDALKQAHAGMQKEVKDQLAEKPSRSDVEQAAQTAVRRGSEEEEARRQSRRFSLLGLNVGPDFTEGYRGNVAFSGKGRFFQAFNTHTAVQAEGEYMYYRNRQEGQLDLGLVNRHGSFQAGGFASFKNVHMRGYQMGANLGQASFTMDYLFGGGRLGAFGSKGFMSEAVINRNILTPTLTEETFLRLTDQTGISWALAAFGRSYFEGNAGAVFRKYGENKFGFTMRFVQPIRNSPFAFTVEGSMNETLVGYGNNGRLQVGFQMGNWLNPREYKASSTPVPVDIPRIRYELGTRVARNGNQPPVADAGPDLLNVKPGQITLDGRGSYDPEGDPVTYAWKQLSGPAVSISGMNTSVATFTAAAGTTYAFTLTVRDDKGAESRDRVTVSTISDESTRVRIFRFQATPMTIRPGEASTLSWETENADTVTIDGIGSVGKNGATTVSPTQTTTYRLTASNQFGEISSTVTVQVVAGQAPRVLRFAATPTEIALGESATLEWNVEGATTLTISGIGNVQLAGSRTLSPTESTTYTLTATNQSGTVTATSVVTVRRPVRVLSFAANPTTIQKAGDPVTLTWSTQDAKEVTITGIGTVANSGNITVNPQGTTTYSLIARGDRDSVTAVVTVTLQQQPPTGGTGGPPVANAGADFTTTSTSVRLDGSQSFSRIGGTLKYSWELIGAGQYRLADISPSGSATPTVTLKSGIGKYVFQLTVEDPEGAKNTDTVTVDLRLP